MQGSNFTVSFTSCNINQISFIKRCMKMSIVHDMGESLIGDITPHCGVSDTEKLRIETEAINKITGLLPATKGAEIRELFQVGTYLLNLHDTSTSLLHSKS